VTSTSVTSPYRGDQFLQIATEKKKKRIKKTVKNGGSHPVGARAARYIADMLHELLATLQ